MKNVLITGGSRGLGLATVKKFLAASWRVYTVSRSITPEIEELNNVKHKSFDLSKVEDIQEEVFNRFVNNQIPIHAVVHNAAIAYDDIVTNPLQ